MEHVTECQSFADFQSLKDTVEALMCGPVSVISSKTVEQANRELREGEAKFPACLHFKNVRLGCKQFGLRAEGKNSRPTHSPAKIQCPAHVIAVADKDMGLLIIKQISLEHNHAISPLTSPDGRRLQTALVEDEHPVSDVGLTITVSCKDDADNEAIPEGSSELKNQLLSDRHEEHIADDEDTSDDEVEDEENDDDNDDDDSDDDEEEESDTQESSRSHKKLSTKTPKKIKITMGKYHKYTEEDMEKAYMAIMNHDMTVHKASLEFGVPKSTLYDRINDRSSYNLGGRPNRGKSKILDKETERQMVDHIKHLESIGQALTQSEILTLASKLAHTSGTIPKIRNLSRGWYKAFLRRWFGDKKTSGASKPRGDYDGYRKPKSKQEYFVTVKSIMDKYKLHNKPHHIYKLDEIVFNMERKASSVPQPQKRAHVFEDSDSVSTVLLCGNALGYSLPPYFAFKKKKNQAFSQGSMDGSGFKVGESGLVSTSTIKDYISAHFIPNTLKREEEQIMLLYEDHASVVTPTLAEWAAQQGVIIYTLPALYSDPSRSLDFGCHYTFCQAFTSVCAEFITDHKKITPRDLSQLVYMSMVRSLTLKNLKASFSQAGIFPFDKSRKELLLAKNLTDSGVGGKRQKSSGRKGGRKRAKVS